MNAPLDMLTLLIFVLGVLALALILWAAIIFLAGVGLPTP